jgi:hypothetical protein
LTSRVSAIEHCRAINVVLPIVLVIHFENISWLHHSHKLTKWSRKGGSLLERIDLVCSLRKFVTTRRIKKSHGEKWSASVTVTYLVSVHV